MSNKMLPYGNAVRFICERRAFVSAKDKPHVQLSNVLMDGQNGGRVALSNDDYEEFLRKYAMDMDAGQYLCVVECKTGTFRFYMDLDVETAAELTDEEKVAIVSHVLGGMRPFLQNPNRGRLHCILACAPPKTKDGMVKNGMHLVFPHLKVSDHEALLFRENVVAELNLNLGRDYCRGGWDAAVDKAVYIGSGLRMIGSVKVSSCNVCHRKDPNCVNCGGSGKIIENRPYRLYGYFDDDGRIDEANTETLRRSTYRLISKASIRCFSNDTCPEFKRFQGAPSYVGPTMQNPTKPPRMPSGVEFSEDRQASRAWKRSRAVVSDERIRQVCERIVRNRVNKARYSNLCVREVNTDSTRSFYDIKVSGQGSSFCQNKMDDHTSNTIYFHIDRAGVTQRCFCRKPIMREAKVTCSKYRSTCRGISEDDSALLFPADASIPSEMHAKSVQKQMQSTSAIPKGHDVGKAIAAMLDGAR